MITQQHAKSCLPDCPLLDREIHGDDILYGSYILRIDFDLALCKRFIHFVILLLRQVAEFVVLQFQTDSLIAGIELNNLAARKFLVHILAEDSFKCICNPIFRRSDNLI